MSVSYEFAFPIKADVTLKAIRVKGVIDSISKDITGNQYRVVYWNDGARCSTWVYEWEIE